MTTGSRPRQRSKQQQSTSSQPDDGSSNEPSVHFKIENGNNNNNNNGKSGSDGSATASTTTGQAATLMATQGKEVTNSDPSTTCCGGVGSTKIIANAFSAFQKSTTATTATPTKLCSTALRANMTGRQCNRDPLFYYQVESVLGIGSMGSVAKVRKRASVIGGSARKELQDHFAKERRWNACFHVPVIGGFFQYCFKGQLEFKEPALMSVSTNSSSSTAPNDSGSRRSAGYHHNSHSSSGRNAASSVYYNPVLSNLTNVSSNHDDHHHHDHDMLFAMKSIHLSRVTNAEYLNELKNEIEILKTLDHPHIVKAIETFEHRNQIFIIMELCSGGDLYSRDPYTEEEAARIIRAVLSAIAYMHSKHIIHRDLKYENILFVNNSPQAEVKLIDFGLSAAFGNDELTDGVGTIYTMAPEVLRGKYSKQADLWSVGVIAYILLSSQMPFYGTKRSHIVEQIMAGKYEFKGRRWQRVSNQGKAFVQDLLVIDPNDRLTAEQALSAAWLNRRHRASVRNPYEQELEQAHASMIRYSKYSKLKKVALMIVAHKSTCEEIGILRKIFQQYDHKGKGYVGYDEFKAAVAAAGYTEDDTRQIFDAMDLDGTGMIRYTEFLASTIEAQGAIDERRLAEAFDRLDCDDSGYITVQDLRQILGEEFPAAEIDNIIAESDFGHDGKISYVEFLAQWQDSKEAKREEAISCISELQQRQKLELHSECSGGTISNTSSDNDLQRGSSHGSSVMSRINFIQQKIGSDRSSTANPVSVLNAETVALASQVNATMATAMKTIVVADV